MTIAVIIAGAFCNRFVGELLPVRAAKRLALSQTGHERGTDTRLLAYQRPNISQYEPCL